MILNKKIPLIILTIVFCYQWNYSQNEPIEFNYDDLIGVWHQKFNRKRSDNLIFEKKVMEHKYGLSIEILANREFHSRYSAPCGNTRMLYTHNYNGKWHLNKEEWILTTTKPINQKETMYKIIELKSDKLILMKIT